MLLGTKLVFFLLLDYSHVCRSLLYMINLWYSLWKVRLIISLLTDCFHQSHPTHTFQGLQLKSYFWIHKSCIMLVEFYYPNIVNHRLNLNTKNHFLITFVLSNVYIYIYIYITCRYTLSLNSYYFSLSKWIYY